MTKRVRGAARTHRRPGARPASERGTATARRRSVTVAPASPVEPAEEAATYVVEEPPVEAAAVPESITRARASHRVKAGSLLATRAATEYVYVAKDMRRILVVATVLVGVMIVLWLLLVVMRVVPLPFY